MSTLAFPFSAAPNGRSNTRERDQDARIRDLLELLVFTTPGERVMRADLGSPARQLVFENVDETAGIALQAALHAAINRWLGDLLELRALDVETDMMEGALMVSITYEVRRSRIVHSVQLRKDRT
jgi:uncharacterized protein